MRISGFVALLSSCSRNRDLRRGIALHDAISKRGLVEACSDALVTMYAKCNELNKAKELLYTHDCRDVVAWSSLIAGYAQRGQGQNALDCYEEMRLRSVTPDALTFACALKACGIVRANDKGMQIHNEVASEGLLGKSIMLGNALVHMYAKCGALDKAHRVLEELPSRNVTTWNALMTGYAQQCEGEKALICFEQMQHKGLSPDAYTFTCILKACGSIGAVDKGKEIHDEVVRRGFVESDNLVGTALVDMYAKCGAFARAHEVLDKLPVRDVFSWSALISGYAEQGHGEQALLCYEAMKHEGIAPNRVTFLSVLKACGSFKEIAKGEQVHEEISRQELLKNDTMLGNAVADMYAKCGALVKAEQVIDELADRNVVSWSTLIAGYIQQDQGEKALLAFEKMQAEGHSPNEVTFACILKACGIVGAIEKGEEVHNEIVRQGFLGKNALLGNALMDMYARCGALTKAQQVHSELSVRDVVSWNTLIAGYAQEGEFEAAWSAFEDMQREGLCPDSSTFLCLLKACGSTGAIAKGEQIHDTMSRQRLLASDARLSTALVDMYAKCGALAKAHQVLQELRVGDEISYSVLLGACEKQLDVNLGRWAFERAVEANRKDAVIYAAMGNIYAAAGMQKDAELVEFLRVENGAL